MKSPTAVLTFGILLTIASPISGQQFEMIHPNGLTAISEKPLPGPVYASQQNILRIRGEFFLKNQPDARVITIQATGFMVSAKQAESFLNGNFSAENNDALENKSGYIVSARHLLVSTIMELAKRFGEPFHLDMNGIPRGVNYDYRFFAILDTAVERREYQLEISAMGPMGTYLDVIWFKTNKKIPVKNLALSNNVKPGDTVYASGFSTQGSRYYERNGGVVPIITDEIKFTSEHILLAPILNNAIISSGVKKLYRLAKPTQPGFSGGPILNKNGQVVGLMIERDGLFAFAISSEDLATVVKLIK